MFDAGFKTILPIAFDIEHPTIDTGFCQLTLVLQAFFDIGHVPATKETPFGALGSDFGQRLSCCIVNSNVMTIRTLSTMTTIEYVSHGTQGFGFLIRYGATAGGDGCSGSETPFFFLLFDANFPGGIQAECTGSLFPYL